MRVRLARPYISYDEVEEEFREVFESGIFTRGQHVEVFSEQLAEYTGAKYAFLTTSATTALWMCLKLLHIGKNDEVIVSDFSFPASANVIEDLGAVPVFADVNSETFNMLPSELEQKITSRTKAVMFVDALGNPAGVTEIKAICERHHLPLIEDAACAIGSAENGKRCGSIADLTCFSFHPRKLLSTGEGGAITTHRDDWAEWLRVKLLHGARGMNGVAMDFVDYGYNFRLPELQAIMGCKQLAKIDAIVDERLSILRRYKKQLEPLGFFAQVSGERVRHNVQSLVFKVPEGYNRDALILFLKEQGIETTIGTYAMSHTSYYLSKYAREQRHSTLLEQTTVTLPCYSGVQVDEVVKEIKRWLNT